MAGRVRRVRIFNDAATCPICGFEAHFREYTKDEDFYRHTTGQYLMLEACKHYESHARDGYSTYVRFQP